MDISQIQNKKEVDYENKKTMKLLNINFEQLKKLLLTKTHSELRTGKSLDDVLYIKKCLGTKNILNK